MGGGLEMMPELCENVDDILDSCIYNKLFGCAWRKVKESNGSLAYSERGDDIFNKLDSFVIGLDENEFISACKKKFYKSTQI